MKKSCGIQSKLLSFKKSLVVFNRDSSSFKKSLVVFKIIQILKDCLINRILMDFEGFSHEILRLLDFEIFHKNMRFLRIIFSFKILLSLILSLSLSLPLSSRPLLSLSSISISLSLPSHSLFFSLSRSPIEKK